VAFNPEVEKLGFVFPSRNAPHSGCPNLAHPAGSCASERTSDQPIALLGHPRASAMGFGIAMTRGVCATWENESGTMLGASRAASRCRRITTHEDDAGLQTSGLGPSMASSQPLARASAAPPEALEVTLTWTHLSPMLGSVRS
jgi:hypothetical protein